MKRIKKMLAAGLLVITTLSAAACGNNRRLSTRPIRAIKRR